MIKNFFEINFKDQVIFDEPMKKHTSFKIGGYADILFLPKNKSDVIKVINFCTENHIKYFVMGNGTNLLVADSGFQGVIIKINKKMNAVKINYEKKEIWAEAGILLNVLAKQALENNFSGMEFASGIPGTLGGAICMNAGAYGREIKDIFVSAEVLYKNKIKIMDDLKFDYRKSLIDKNYVVLSAKIKLNDGEHNKIKNKMEEYKIKRKNSQPLNFFNAGSTFKRPKNNFAGKLIMDAGLADYKIGGEKKKKKHCGFIINLGDATAKNVLDLISYVKQVVYEKFGVQLEEEIKFLS